MQKMELEQIHVFVTDKCNMRCPHCYVDSSGRFKDELDKREMISLFNQLNSVHFTGGIHIEGGEPFLRKDLVDFLTELYDISHATIATNGTVKYDPRYDAIKGIERIGFSVEGATQEVHRKLRPNDIEKLWGNMVLFQKKGFSVQSRTTLTSQNYHELEAIVAEDYAREIPIARFQAFTPVGRGAKEQHLSLTLIQYAESINRYIDAVTKYGNGVLIKLSFPTVVEEKLDLTDVPQIANITRTVCYKGCNQVAIAANGDVFQCYNLLNYPENLLGNVRQRPFQEIVSTQKFFQKDSCPNKLCVSQERGYTHFTNKNRM